MINEVYRSKYHDKIYCTNFINIYSLSWKGSIYVVLLDEIGLFLNQNEHKSRHCINILFLHSHSILYSCLYKNDQCAVISKYIPLRMIFHDAMWTYMTNPKKIVKHASSSSQVFLYARN